LEIFLQLLMHKSFMNIPILLYHSVSDQASNLYKPWAISSQVFESHIAYLYNQGFQPMTVDAIAQALCSKGVGIPERPVAITFDDGMADFLIHAMPILRKYHFPSTLFITTAYVGYTSSWLARKDERLLPMLSWDEIASLDGVCLGAHSHTHPQLDIIPLSQARDEIGFSKRLLEQQLGFPINTFAFPHGYHTQKLKELVKEEGYTSACIVEHTMATAATDVYAIPRIIITSDVTTEMLEKYLQGVGLRKKNAWRTILRTTWRMLRRTKGSTVHTGNHYD